MVRRPRDAPAEAALDRADVDDRLRASVGVRGVVLPGRDPLANRGEHLVQAQDRVPVAPALAEGGVDELTVDADAQPERAEVAEDDLPLGRLAEQAHVGDASVRDEIPRPGGVAAVLRPDRVAVLRLLDLAADGGDQHVAAQPDTRVAQRPDGLDVARERALHVRDPEPVEPPVPDERLGLEPRHVSQPRLAPRVRRVHVPVEHEARAAAGALEDPERVGAAVLDLLPLTAEPELLVERGHQLGHALLVAREAPDADHAARRLDEPLAVDGDRHRRHGRAGAPSRRTGGSARGGRRPRARA